MKTPNEILMIFKPEAELIRLALLDYARKMRKEVASLGEDYLLVNQMLDDLNHFLFSDD